jgi:hypothetical protein
MGNPSLEAYDAAIGIVCYLYRTRELGITYGGEIRAPDVEIQKGSAAINTQALADNNGLLSFSDASFARDQDLASVSGFVTMYKNGAISWSSKKIKIVCLSTTEAETVGATLAAQDVKYVRALMTDIGLAPTGPTPFFLDSSGTFGYVRHQSAKQRTKYFDLWVAFVRSAHRDLSIDLHLITTATMVADIFTKALARAETVRFRDFMLQA